MRRNNGDGERIAAGETDVNRHNFAQHTEVGDADPGGKCKDNANPGVGE